jgi:16S rRNA (uracil1498-N3)-methyltransferase
MQLFYIPDLNENSKTAIFNSDESRHLFKVLRKKVGDEVLITNGNQLMFKGNILDISKNNCEVEISKCEKKEKLGYSLHIVISILKSNERFEWFLEKASEIGITEITPVLCERSEKKFINEKRLNKVLISAMKQSLKANLPILNPIVKLKDFYKSNLSDQLFIAHCNESEKDFLISSIKPKENITILIGPEGDFSKNEVEEAIKIGFKPVSLGNTRFRAETAGIIATHTVSIANM